VFPCLFHPFYHIFPGDDSTRPECVGEYTDKVYVYNMIYILNMSIFIWDYLNNFTSSLRKHQSLRLYRIPAIVMDGLIAFRTCTLASCSLLIFCVCSFVELCTLWYSPAKDKGVSHLHMTSRRFQYSPASRKETVRILIKLLLIVKHVFPLRVNQISSIGITK